MDGPNPAPALGALLRDFVNRVSHRGGRTLAVMNEAAVTLPQVLILNRLAKRGSSTQSELGERLSMSPAALSQMIERLHQAGLVMRAEMADDRRRKRLSATRKGRALLARIEAARAADYEAGVAALSPAARAALAAALDRALQELQAVETA